MALALALALLALTLLALALLALALLTAGLLVALADCRSGRACSLPRALLQRLGRAGETLGTTLRVLSLVAGRALAERRLRLIQALTHLVDPARDVALGSVRLLIRSAADERLRIAHRIAKPVVSNGAGGLGHLARGRTLFAARVARGLVEIGFELPELGFELVLLLVDLTSRLRSRRRIGRQLTHLIGDLLLLPRDLFGVAPRIGDVALGALRQRSLQPLLGLAQPLERRLRLGRRIGIAARGRTPHRIGRFAGLTRSFLQLRPLLFAREPLQPPRRFFGLFGQRALLRTATAAAALTLQRPPPLTLGFLLLASRQLLQLLEQLVDLAVVLLFRRLVGRLVAIGHLVELLLEDLGQLLLHRAAATTAAATLLTAHADLRLVLFLGLLQDLQRLVLGRQRLIRVSPRSTFPPLPSSPSRPAAATRRSWRTPDRARRADCSCA